jgi:site-specific DNA recombinase
VRARQAKLDAEPGVQAIKASRFWERRRAVHVLTNRAFCGSCGGTLAAAGRDFLACSNARNLGTCSERKGIRRAVLEEFLLGPVRSRLIAPDAVKAFVSAYCQEINAGRDTAAAERRRREKELSTRRAKLEGYYNAAADGLRTPGLLARIEELEAELAGLEATLNVEPVQPHVRLHPGLADAYRQQVAALGEVLADPLIARRGLGPSA